MTTWEFIAYQFSNKAPGRTLTIIRIFNKPKTKSELWSQLKLGILYFGFIMVIAWYRVSWA